VLFLLHYAGSVRTALPASVVVWQWREMLWWPGEGSNWWRSLRRRSRWSRLALQVRHCSLTEQCGCCRGLYLILFQLWSYRAHADVNHRLVHAHKFRLLVKLLLPENGAAPNVLRTLL